MSCCKDCTKRHVGCHDKCEEYANFKKELKEKKRVKTAMMQDKAYYSYLSTAKHRMQKQRCSNGIMKSGR